MPLHTGQILQNRYRIVKLIGQGGFGAVYRAWDMNLKRPCAVKENLDASAEAQKQFNQEMELLARLYHNSLPRFYDYFFLSGVGQYMVMDFIEGEDLQAMLARRGRLLEAEVIPWIVQICDALNYMHSQKPAIIHRDIKPANIIVTPEGRAMLVDFGISKVHDPLLKTTVGARAVTPGVSPLEQYGQGGTDNRSDIYALGATLYALLTGQEPPESILLVGGGASLTPPRQLNPTITPHVAQAIERALQTRPADRFATVNEFSKGIQISSHIAQLQRDLKSRFPAQSHQRPQPGYRGKPQRIAAPKHTSKPQVDLKNLALSVAVICFVAILGFGLWSSQSSVSDVRPSQMDSRYQKIYLISLARVYAFTNNRDYIAYVDNSWRNTLGTICQMIDEEIDWAEQARLTSVVMVLTESGSCPENVASTLVSSRYTPEHLEPRSQAIYIQVVADLYAFDNNRSWAYAAFERWDSADETICELRLNQPDVSYQARLNHLAALLNGVGCE